MFGDPLYIEVLNESYDSPDRQMTLTIPVIRIGAAIRRQFKNQVASFVSVSSWREEKHWLSSDLYDFRVTATPKRLLTLMDWMEDLTNH